MWFVFPQVAGLGRSPTAQHFAISALAEARAYLAHPVLGPRLVESPGRWPSSTAGPGAVLGSVDAQKLRSSMTLFIRAAPEEPVFRAVLDRYFDGAADRRRSTPLNYGVCRLGRTARCLESADFLRSKRSRCGTTVYFGSRADAWPASKIPNRVQADPASSASTGEDRDATRLRPPNSAPSAAGGRERSRGPHQPPAGPGAAARPSSPSRLHPVLADQFEGRAAHRQPAGRAGLGDGGRRSSRGRRRPPPRSRRTRTAARGRPRARPAWRCRRAGRRCTRRSPAPRQRPATGRRASGHGRARPERRRAGGQQPDQLGRARRPGQRPVQR